MKMLRTLAAGLSLGAAACMSTPQPYRTTPELEPVAKLLESSRANRKVSDYYKGEQVPDRYILTPAATDHVIETFLGTPGNHYSFDGITKKQAYAVAVRNSVLRTTWPRENAYLNALTASENFRIALYWNKEAANYGATNVATRFRALDANKDHIITRAEALDRISTWSASFEVPEMNEFLRREGMSLRGISAKQLYDEHGAWFLESRELKATREYSLAAYSYPSQRAYEETILLTDFDGDKVITRQELNILNQIMPPDIFRMHTAGDYLYFKWIPGYQFEKENGTGSRMEYGMVALLEQRVANQIKQGKTLAAADSIAKSITTDVYRAQYIPVAACLDVNKNSIIESNEMPANIDGVLPGSTIPPKLALCILK